MSDFNTISPDESMDEFFTTFPVDFFDDPPQGNRKENKRKPPQGIRMSTQEWSEAIPIALKTLQQITPRLIDEKAFTFEPKKSRYTLKPRFLSLFQIFPWFHTNSRFRQTLRSCVPSQAPTIAKVLEAVNYFYKRYGKEYTVSEIEFLRNYYQNMEIPSTSECFVLIIGLCDLFQKFQQTLQPLRRELVNEIEIEKVMVGPHEEQQVARSNTPLSFSVQNLDLNKTIHAHDNQLNSLNIRIELLEETLEAIETPKSLSHVELIPQHTKRISRMGGDRACWFKIRDEDYHSRHEWCVPGGVFGLYSDGVGPLLPTHLRLRRSVLVYSTDPDTLEEHPNPSHFDHYVRVVMVGEAPVNLRPDQYEKLRRDSCICDLYVNHLGDVCVHSENEPPMEGTKFGITIGHHSTSQDEEGYPIFQGVRGVCAKINTSSQSTGASFRTGNSLWKQASRAIQTLIHGEVDLPVRQVMKTRLEIFRQLVSIDQILEHPDLSTLNSERHSLELKRRDLQRECDRLTLQLTITKSHSKI